MKMTYTCSWALSCTLLLCLCCGCSTLGGKQTADSDGRFNLMKRFNLKKDKAEDFNTPHSMVAIWKASTFEKAGAKSIRGFGGRFYFYDANNEPVRVKGDLTVYGYDDNQQAPTSNDGKADRKFVFKADSINSHFSESALGESYSFWVPWDEVGGEEKTITLIPVFKTVDGHMPEAKPATMRLPGRRAEKSKALASAIPHTSTTTQGVVQASAEFYDTAPAQSLPGSTVISPRAKQQHARRKPTTLRLTPRLAEHLATPKVQPNQQSPAIAPTGPIGPTGPTAVPAKTTTDSESNDSNPNHAKQAIKPLLPQPQLSQPSQQSRRPAVFGQPGAFR